MDGVRGVIERGGKGLGVPLQTGGLRCWGEDGVVRVVFQVERRRELEVERHRQR